MAQNVDEIVLQNGQFKFQKDLLRRYSLADNKICVFLGGSLTEGLGNSTSDLDIYAITDSLPRLHEFDERLVHRLLTEDRRIIRPEDDPQTPVFIAHYSLGDTTMKVDVEFLSIQNLNGIVEKLNDIHTYAASNLVLLTRRLSLREENLVMRVLNGIPLTQEGSFHELQASFDRSKVQYLAYRWLASDYSHILDIIGAWRAGEAQRCTDLARENMVRQMQAYLHLKGMFNLRRKWLLKFVDRLLQDETDVASQFLKLFHFDGVGDASNYVNRTLDFVDELFYRSVPLLVANGSAPTGQKALELLARDRDLSSSRYAELEFEYRAKVYGQIGRPTRAFLGDSN